MTHLKVKLPKIHGPGQNL